MNSLDTIYLPDTAIISDDQSPLFLFFSTIHLIQPVEEGDEQIHNSFMENRFYQLHTPHPLGEDRERFLYLINDIKNRKDDYASQLSHLTLASMGGAKNIKDDTAGTIMSSILGSKPSKSEKDGEQDELWQPRLILKIAEILDKEEAELAQAFIHLDGSEEDLFEELKGEGDDDETASLIEDLHKIKAKMNQPTTASIEKRVHAWFKLIEGGNIPNCKVWTCSRKEVADLLFDNHLDRTGNFPALVKTFDLPARVGETKEEVTEKIKSFREQIGSLNIEIDKMLSSDAINEAKDNDNQKWKEAIDTHFQAQIHGRTSLRIYRFQNDLPSYSGLESTSDMPGPNLLAVLGD